MVDRRLLHHLVTRLGQWPSGKLPLMVVGSPRRTEPGWDGQIHPVVGVVSPTGGVLSVSPDLTRPVRQLVKRELPEKGLGGVLAGLPAAVGLSDHVCYRAVFRWTVDPAPLPDAGVWLPADDPVVPAWLRPFGLPDSAGGTSDVLIARDPDTGAYLAGVGLKRHDQYGHELAVGTAPAARGRGLARRLVAQAARRVLESGAVVTYQHDPANELSARVADAAGLPDRGWTSFGVQPPDPPG